MDSGQISSVGRELEMGRGSGKHQSEICMLMEEILSLQRERQDLAGSLTPSISYWRERVSPTATEWMVAGRGTMAVSIIKPASSILQSGSEQVHLPHAVRDVQKELGNYFDFVLQDIEHLGHRMLSTSHFLWSSRAPVSSCQADELVRTTSKLMQISTHIYDAGVDKSKEDEKKQRKKHKEVEEDTTKKMERKKEEEQEKMGWKKENQAEQEETRKKAEMMRSHEFFRLSSNVREKPNHYKNELAMMFTEDDEKEYEREMEAERQAEMERKQRKQKKKQQQQIVVEQGADQNRTKSPMELLKEDMDTELLLFASHRKYWEDTNISKTGQCGRFQDNTTLSPMQFTHYTPGITLPPAAFTGTTVQIYSFKITRLHNDLKWPLYVYGEVAARDTVDRNRNLLFCRSEFRGQVLTENDSSLCLTGPSRAIVAEDPVDFEVELRIIEGDDEIKDRVLMSLSKRYDGAEQPLCFHGSMCSAELSLGRLAATVQATIVGVRVGEGRWPFEFGGRVTCSLYSVEVDDHSCDEVVLLDSAEKIPEDGLDGYISLSRSVVSVQLQGRLKVSIQAYGRSEPPVDVEFHPQDCNITMGSCSVYGTKVDITVAWSRLVRDKMDLLIEGYSTQA
ncbi:unnamed protein product [Triticum turgidum subsp. durum]|uniref:DUF6598 domain-containing protein n=1 Tax=Triticum turgidum subsp. durum TaxID=4567 RepID=A0A9R1RFA7_TRITD|nr:unnamed protein product [Triticum turgidum subsp. durum]